MSAYQNNENHTDFMNEPWWKTPVASGVDYTKRRAAVSYTMDDLIGRKDTNKYKLVTTDPTTVSGTGGTVLT